MSIKQNAESMEDKTIYFEIKDVDLIAKELRYHRHCYKEFTRKKSERLLNVNETQKGDYQKDNDIIEKLVLNQNQAVSMANIHNAYALHPNDTRYRSKLKERIENDYKKQLLFVKFKNNSPDVVISSKALLDTHLILNEVLLKEAAVILRNDILDYLNNMSEIAWPPDIENLASDDELPNQVTMFQKKYFSRQKTRTLELPDKLSYSPTINPKKEPLLTNFRNQETNNYNNHNFQEKYLIWLLFRLLNDKDQTIPTIMAGNLIYVNNILKVILKKICYILTTYCRQSYRV